ncbi:MAG: DUF6345 domain-containing protein [Actinomycetota bacterium]|nr:DUF6345 domain-containing protein [Actinomycetota bacterium]
MQILEARSAFAENPFGEATPAQRADREPGDSHGAFSIETFSSAGGLSETHEDAGGWIEYLNRFQPSNFHYQDGGVAVWAYEEEFDNWEDTYGMDACLAVYHSGHGNMAADGTFQAPLGAEWGGLGDWAFSNRMHLGDEQANYIFWSTCLSLRVYEGHDPVRTWHAANGGFRMLFGFETISVDRPEYGRWFWEEWNAGDSLSRAWLDASWRISTNQAPSVVACGATSEEATNRLYNERNLEWPHVSNSWYQWTWYDVARGARGMRERNLTLPKELLVAELRPVDLGQRRIQGILERHDVDLRPPQPDDVFKGTMASESDDIRLAFRPNGSYDLRLAQPNVDNRDQISIDQARTQAQEALRTHGLDAEVDLTFDRVRHTMTAGRSSEGGGDANEPEVFQSPHAVETTVQFRQTVNGLPTITPGAGQVRVTVDNDGTITRLHDSTRQLDRLSERPKTTTATPGVEGPIARPRAPAGDIERLLAEQWRKRMQVAAARGAAPLSVSVVPGSTEVGYDLRKGSARLVAQRELEVDFGDGLRKRYQVVAPILE